MTTPSATADAIQALADETIAAVITALCEARGAGKTICPTEAAQAAGDQAGGDALSWRLILPRVRAIAVQLARAGRIVIFRKGKPVDPDDFRGVYRLGLPHQT